ncbi:MAG: hypothetical protein DRN01_03880 [Thermoplasmata archaeon]|nr:MAG: hypothetical protein DRN01_03880 [Thermoplasmata archaeon]
MEMKNSGNPKEKMLAVLLILLILGVVMGAILSKASLSYVERQARRQGRLDSSIVRGVWNAFVGMYTLGTIIICMNLMLLLGLLGAYIQSYRRTKSSFLLGLIMFLGVLVAQSLLSLPILHVSVGTVLYRSNIFTILPNLFETIALIILFYLSME